MAITLAQLKELKPYMMSLDDTLRELHRVCSVRHVYQRVHGTTTVMSAHFGNDQCRLSDKVVLLTANLEYHGFVVRVHTPTFAQEIFLAIENLPDVQAITGIFTTNQDEEEPVTCLI